MESLLLFLVNGARHFTNKEFLCKCKCPSQKAKFYSVFRDSPAVSQELSSQNNPMPKKQIWGLPICYPSKL